MPESLRTRIEHLVASDSDSIDLDTAESTLHEFIESLNQGQVRAAVREEDGTWQTQAWVKQGILLGFRLGRIVDYSAGSFRFFDKHTFPLKDVRAEDRVRIVPGGSAIRTGAYLASGVVCMPPMYVNVGAYVDEGTMIDSHALVGSCAQIGRNVHLSAAAQIGGVLEPIGARPVIIEDDVFVGGGCGVYEGCLVRRGAVLAPGTILSGSTRLYDLVHGEILSQTETGPLEVPPYAVVVPGSRNVQTAFAAEHGLSLYTPIIVKYRDASTDAATTLETALR